MLIDFNFSKSGKLPDRPPLTAFACSTVSRTDPLKKKSTFNFSQTVGKMVFVSFEVEKMRMFLVQSVVRWCWVLVRSLGAVVSFPV